MMPAARKPWLVYALCVIALWLVVPEIRRFTDWRLGGGLSNILVVLPFASMLPTLVVMRTWVRGFAVLVLMTMLASLSYAAAVGIAAGNGLASVLYTFADFLLPLVFGGWLAQRASVDPEGFARLARVSLWLMAVSSAYGIFTYVALTPWDALWLNNGPISTGVAAPFQFRVFGMSNGPGAFATLLVLVLVLNLNELAKRRWVDLLATAVCIAALALSLVRSAWIALAIAIVVYFLLSPARAKLLGAFALIVLILAIPVAVSLGGSPYADQVTTGFVSRLGTLSDVGDDDSALNRSDQIRDAYATARKAPLGLGLGVYGTVTKFSTVAGDVVYLDSGYLARFVELGLFGSAAMALAVAASIMCGFLAACRRTKDANEPVPLYCCLFALQIAMLWFNVSGDLLRSGPGILFWLAAFTAIGVVDRANLNATARRLHYVAFGARL